MNTGYLSIFVSSLISFINVLKFPVYRSFISFFKFIPKYYYFGAIINGIVFLIYFPDNQLLVYRNATDFCMLFLYLATLLNLFISSNSFLWTLQFSMYKIVSSAIRDHFTSSLQIWMTFVTSSCLIVLARTFNTMLKRSVESGDPFVLFLILVGNLSTCHH